MSWIPRVTERSREQIARDFDARGPDVCLAEIVTHLEQNNPKVLNMAVKCAVDLNSAGKVMTGFGMFYRLLLAQLPTSPSATGLVALPRVTADTRALLVAEIDDLGPETFTTAAIAELDESNPELLQMAHNFAADFGDYLRAMQGFALLYRSLIVQFENDRTNVH